MKPIKKFLLAAALFYALVYACIPIDDVVPPQISNFELNEEETYFYQDTLRFDVVFIDNALLDSAVVQIQRSANEAAEENPWDTIVPISLLGRRLEQQYALRIPEYKATGAYDIIVTAFDNDGNTTESTQSFLLEDDRTNPIFENVSLDLDFDPVAGAYLACRSEIVGIEGGVSDNLSVNRIGFELSTGQEDAVPVSSDSLGIAPFFGRSVIIPPDIPNGTTLTLTLFAIDTFQNRVNEDFIINIACDDIPPQINVASTFPSLNANNFTNVTQGTRFSIDSLVISDNEFLESVQVYFNTQGEPLVLYDDVTLNTSSMINLADSVYLNFSIPEDAPIGLTQEITIIASDSSNNFSTPVTLTYSVIEDAPPVILVTNTYINQVETDFSVTELIPLRIGQVVSFDGKIEELNALQLVTVFWGVAENPEPLVTLNNINTLPLNLSSLQENVTFRVPNNAEVGSTFLLRINAVDTRGGEDTVEYRFVIRE